MKTSAAFAAAAVLAALVATSAAAADKPAAKDECFWARNVTSFAAPDDHTVYVKVNQREVYKFDLFISCPEIDWRQSLAIRSSTDSICSGMDAEIISHEPGLGRLTCPVKNMHKLTPDEIAALPKRARP